MKLERTIQYRKNAAKDMEEEIIFLGGELDKNLDNFTDNWELERIDLEIKLDVARSKYNHEKFINKVNLLNKKVIERRNIITKFFNEVELDNSIDVTTIDGSLHKIKINKNKGLKAFNETNKIYRLSYDSPNKMYTSIYIKGEFMSHDIELASTYHGNTYDTLEELLKRNNCEENFKAKELIKKVEKQNKIIANFEKQFEKFEKDIENLDLSEVYGYDKETIFISKYLDWKKYSYSIPKFHININK